MMVMCMCMLLCVNEGEGEGVGSMQGDTDSAQIGLRSFVYTSLLF